MTDLSYSKPLVAGTPENINNVQADLDDVKTVINGNLDDGNIRVGAGIKLSKLESGDFSTAVGVNVGSTTRRGASFISPSEALSSASYSLMPTPDQVSNVVLPANGLLAIGYKARWSQSVPGTARAAIFLGTNQLRVAQENVVTPVLAEAVIGSSPVNNFLTTTPIGLETTNGPSLGQDVEVTTGQALGAVWGSRSLGGLCYVFAAPGTYTVSIQFLATSGSVTVSNRKLWVVSLGF